MVGLRIQENILVVFSKRVLVAIRERPRLEGSFHYITLMYCNEILLNNSSIIACYSQGHNRCSHCSGISGRLRNSVDFHCRRCLDGDSVQAVLLREV